MTGLDQERRRRVLLRAVIPLGSGPEDAQHDQHQQYRADGDMPGHQVLAHPVLTIVDAVEEFQELPDDQQPHAPVKQPGNTTVALFRIIHVLFLSHLRSFSGPAVASQWSAAPNPPCVTDDQQLPAAAAPSAGHRRAGPPAVYPYRPYGIYPAAR